MIREFGYEVVFGPLHGEELGIIEVPDHAVMRKIFKQEGDPSVRVGPDGKGDILAMNPRRQLDLEGLHWLGDRRLPLPTSAV